MASPSLPMSRIVPLARLLLALCLAVSARAGLAQVAASALPEGVTAGPTVEGITEYRLGNGMKALLAPDASKPTTTVNVTYLVGSRHESYGETGMAHLLEHLMFKGTPSIPDLPQQLARRGMRANATTWLDRTNYFETFPASEAELEWALRMEADRMVNAFVAKKDLDSEMTVVRNEMEAGENDPGGILFEKMLATAYQWHNYGKSTIGARSDVENVDIGRLQAFYRRYYQPDNAVLVVSGRFDPVRALGWIADSFGRLPRPARALDPTYTLEPVQDGERQVTLRRVGDVQHVGVVYHVPPGASPDFAAIDLLVRVLGDTPAGRLHKALVETRLATGVFGAAFALAEPGFVALGAELRAEAPLERARQELLRVVEDIARAPITAEEVERAKARRLKAIELTESDPERLGIALSESIAQGDWRLYFLQRDRIRALTAEQVQRAAVDWLKPSNRTLGLFVPTASPDRAPAPARVDVAPMVAQYRGQAGAAAGEAFEATPENIERRVTRATLPGGVRLALLPKKTRGATVSGTIRLNLGSVESLRGLATVGELTASMLERGTARRSREQIQAEFDRLRARVSIGGGATAVSVRFQTVRESVPELLGLLAEILREPAFPESELEQLREAALGSIEASRSEPNALASLALARHRNPWPRDDVRYAPTLDEQAQEVKAVRAEGLRAFHARFYGSADAVVALVGDFDPEAARAALAARLDGWSAPERYVRVPDPFRDVPPVRLVQNTPDKANAVYLAELSIALADDDPDFAALQLANLVLGGDPLHARLGERIRQKEGLSYDVGSYVSVSSDEPSGRFGLYAIYAPENRERLEAAVREELSRAVTGGVTEAELRDAKAGLLQRRALARAQDATLASALAEYLRLGRTFEFSARLDARIREATLGEVNAALRRHVDPARLSVSLAGDFDKPANR